MSFAGDRLSNGGPSVWSVLQEGRHVTLTWLTPVGEAALSALAVTVDRTEVRMLPIGPEVLVEAGQSAIDCFLAFDHQARTWAIRGTADQPAPDEVRFRASEMGRLCKRRSSRLVLRRPIELCVWHGPQPITLCTHTVNISADGALCAEAGQLRIGDQGRFWLYLTDDCTIAGELSVVRTVGNQAALEFQGIRPVERERVNHFVFAAKRDAIAVQAADPPARLAA